MRYAIAAFIIVGLYLIEVPKAGADPMTHDASIFCRMLDINSTPAGVRDAVNEFGRQGVTMQATKNTVFYALTELCPEYESAFVAAYSGKRLV